MSARTTTRWRASPSPPLRTRRTHRSSAPQARSDACFPPARSRAASLSHLTTVTAEAFWMVSKMQSSSPDTDFAWAHRQVQAHAP